MQTHLLLALALIGPTPEPSALPQVFSLVVATSEVQIGTDLDLTPQLPVTPSLVATPWTEAEIRDHLHLVVRRMMPFSGSVAARDVPDLVLLAQLVEASPDFLRSEKVSIQRVLGNRLVEHEAQLQRQAAQIERNIARAEVRQARLQQRNRTSHLAGSSNSSATPEYPETTLKARDALDSASLNGGAGELAQAQQLIDLIHAVVAPETWDVNGGNGSVRYLPGFYTLIIRAPQDIHRQIGGTLTTLQQTQR